MENSPTIMTRLNAMLSNSVIGEFATFGFAGGAGVLSWMEAITPIIGFVGVILGCIAGFYTIIIRRKQLCNMNHSPDQDQNELN